MFETQNDPCPMGGNHEWVIWSGKLRCRKGCGAS
jgi:hypothetical protein